MFCFFLKDWYRLRYFRFTTIIFGVTSIPSILNCISGSMRLSSFLNQIILDSWDCHGGVYWRGWFSQVSYSKTVRWCKASPLIWSTCFLSSCNYHQTGKIKSEICTCLFVYLQEIITAFLPKPRLPRKGRMFVSFRYAMPQMMTKQWQLWWVV